MKTTSEIILEIENRINNLEKSEFMDSHIRELGVSFCSAVSTLNSLLDWIKSEKEEGNESK